jgi:hypothetical protein
MAQVAQVLEHIREAEVTDPEVLTLLDLVAAVADAARSEQEVIETVRSLLTSGKVKLVGEFIDRDVQVD